MTDIERRRAAAYWYAVGWADANGTDDIAQEFSEWAADQARAYYDPSSKVYSMQSVPDQFKAYNREKDTK